jgi:hypothetical protein
MYESASGGWVRYSEVEALQRQLAEITVERDQYKRACELADALRNANRLIVAAK